MMQPWFEKSKTWDFYSLGNLRGQRDRRILVFLQWTNFSRKLYEAARRLHGRHKYDPEAWADLFAEAGAQYAVLTTKHHDGVALWPTEQNDLRTDLKTPAKGDLIAPYCEALRKRGLQVGLYYSHLDWDPS